MATKVIIGEGKPRIVIQEETATVISSVTAIDQANKVVTLGTVTLTSAVLNRYLVTKNSDDEETKGKIIQFDNDTDKVKTEGFDNGFPAAGAEATIINKVIDLPFCKEISEAYEPVMGKEKTKYHNRKKIRTLKGFYYYATLDYSNYAKRSMLASLVDIYDATRGNAFLFYPRVDNSNVFYECEIDGAEYFNIAQHIKNQGHKYVKLSFEGLSMLTKIPLDESLLDIGMSNIIVQDDTYVIEDLDE